MNIDNGEILGLGSFPTYDPTELTQPMSQAQVDELYRSEAAPLFNRATEGLYPTGSTYKIITALAGLENGLITPQTVIDDTGKIERRRGDLRKLRRRRQRADRPGPGAASLLRRLLLPARAEDVENEPPAGMVAQDGDRPADRARPAGLDQRPGAEQAVARQALREGETERPWSAGDNIQLAIGQGDLQTEPAADGDRLRGARQRRQRSSPRTSGSRSRTAPGGC